MKLKIRQSGIIRLNYATTCVGLAILEILLHVQLVRQYVFLSELIDALQWIFLLYIFISIFLQKYSLKRLLIFGIAILILAYSYMNCGMAALFKYSLILMSSQSVCISDIRFYKHLMNVYILCLFCIFILGFVGILPSLIVRRGYSTYGFIHSNSLAYYALSVMCCYIIANYSKLKSKHYLLMIGATLLTALLTSSRTSYLTMLFLIIITIWIKKHERRLKNNKLIILFIMFSVPLLTFTSFFLGVNYNESEPILSKINEITSNRLLIANHLMGLIHPTLFGQEVAIDLVENAYLIAIYSYGIIPAIIAGATYIYALLSSLKHEQYGKLGCLLCFLIHGLTEGSTYEIFVNVALLTILTKPVDIIPSNLPDSLKYKGDQ